MIPGTVVARLRIGRGSAPIVLGNGNVAPLTTGVGAVALATKRVACSLGSCATNKAVGIANGTAVANSDPAGRT